MERKEVIYDTEIAPLMSQIIEICKREKIALLAEFQVGIDWAVSTALLSEEYEPSELQLIANRVLQGQGVGAFSIVIKPKV